MIKINSLHKYFNRGKQNEIHVIDNISLDLPERGMVAIFGRSGCGKTTLLNVIGGLDSYLTGSVEIGGEKINPDSDAMRNRHIGYIFQNYNLNTGVNCFDNVADALRLCGMSDRHDADAIRERTMSALSAVGMAQYASRYPDTLSGGQKQRIAIARAIVKSPSIILADEPTGNLDETNTVIIMDILREIAETRLVLLVTHEANLVDRYCDRVIGLTDGRITSVKENDISSAYVARNKNHIYLGEYVKSSAAAGSVSVDYYGEPAAESVKLTIVNDDGKYYLRIDTPGVHLIDEYGETQLHEGTFEKKESEKKEGKLDLSLLTPFEGKNYGRLFSFFSSFKSGSRILTGKKIRRGKKVLKKSNFFAASYLIAFSLVFTILLSYCASGISVYSKISERTNGNMFYINIGNLDCDRLAEVIKDDEAFIDYCYTSSYLDMSGQSLRVSTGVFETFDYSNYDAYRVNARPLPHALIGESKVIAGSVEVLGANDIVLSKLAADTILSTATYEYISKYADLIGCNLAKNYYGEKEQFRIAAIVDSGELAVYYEPKTLASTLANNTRLALVAASDYGIELAKGEALVGGSVSADYIPEVGEEFKVSGISVTAKQVALNPHGTYIYSEWFKNEGLVRDISGSYYENLESFYSHLPEYAVYCLLCGYHDAWFEYYFGGGNEEALFIAAGDIEYYAACKYREKNGAFPDGKLSDFEIAQYEQGYFALEQQCYNYYNYNYTYNNARYSPTVVYLSDEDYVNAVLGFGETHPVAQSDYYYSANDKHYESYCILILHSSNPEATEAYLRSEFPELPPNNFEENNYEFVTPTLVIEMAISESRLEIIASVVALGVGLALMCICIYFIMRSSMLSKVREIGIHRAVGVSKKNLLFKFAVESTAIALQTLLIGFAVGAYAATTLANGGVTSATFYFPFWLGALTLIFLIGTCILFGILPIATLLRKTPAQILAKYDI